MAVCALAALAVWGAGAAWAEKADRDQPMHIEADAMRYEDGRSGQPQTATFTGHVALTKGTVVMRGDRLMARQDAAGNQSGVMTPAPGQQTFFRQKRDGVNEFIEGEADRMEYDGKAGTVRLTGNAQMRRMAGAAMADDVRGDVIVYNDTTEVYTVDRAPASAAGGKPGRVRATLVPQGGAANRPDPVPLRAAGTLKPAPAGGQR
jgi:lipopolysaccharide export system protein LptA